MPSLLQEMTDVLFLRARPPGGRRIRADMANSWFADAYALWGVKLARTRERSSKAAISVIAATPPRPAWWPTPALRISPSFFRVMGARCTPGLSGE
jgi:hypothetical protein